MPKNATIAVRSHSQEREWLLSLGDGNIFEAVRTLVRQAKEEQTEGDSLSESKRRKKPTTTKKG